jgi:Glutathione S-transferase, N-terminal domain
MGRGWRPIVSVLWCGLTGHVVIRPRRRDGCKDYHERTEAFWMRLYGYFRSSASYRVRIALNIKQIEVEHVSRHLRRGEQNAPEYLSLNPQGLVPTLVLDDGRVLTQSLAIIEWVV